MLEAIEDADVVAGSRIAAGAQVAQQQPLRRRLVGWPFIALTRLLMASRPATSTAASSSGAAPAAEAVFSRQRLDGWVFDAESLAMARRLGFRIREVGIAWSDREASKLSIFRTFVPAVRELLAARRSVRSEDRRPAAAGVAIDAADS